MLPRSRLVFIDLGIQINQYKEHTLILVVTLPCCSCYCYFLSHLLLFFPTLLSILFPLHAQFHIYLVKSKRLILSTPLTLPMLRLHSFQAHRWKDFWKSSVPCHVGIHKKALAEYSQMSINVPGFRPFLRFYASFCIGQISHQQHEG